MRVTYIGHCGFLVETEQVSMLFDYYQGEIPAIRPELPLYVFSSHRHGDHFNPEIFQLPENSHFVLSYDICRGKSFARKYPETLSFQEEGRLTCLRMDVKQEFPEITVWTLKSTDEGVAFLVKLREDGRLLYHCGDLNWWIWEGEPMADNHNMTAKFQREVEKLRALVMEEDESGRGLKAAFLTLDPRQEKDRFCGMDYYRDKIPMQIIFPMHCWDKYEINGEYLAAHPEVRELRPGNPPESAGENNEKCPWMANILGGGEIYEI